MRQRLSLPLRIGIGFGVMGLLLVSIGIVRGNVPIHSANILMAFLVSGGVWFLMSWAVTTAVVDVEQESEETTSSKGQIESLNQ